MNAKTILLIVDMQYDFCSPQGSLYVKGSEKDIVRAGKFISRNQDQIDKIILTQDSHNVIDISHPVFWEDKKGNPPEPFTEINLKKVLGGFWQPKFHRDKAIDYIRKLEKQGEFPHTIWPEHCIIGSRGAAIVDEIMDPLREWSRTGRFYEVVIKGTNPLTEHFGALKANVQLTGYPETHLNTALVDELMHARRIYLAGEAKTHCVASTVKQMFLLSGVVKKLHILEDCMSDIAGFEKLSTPIFEKALKEGATLTSSTETV